MHVFDNFEHIPFVKNRVAVPASLWGEWCAAGPLLMLTVLTTITEKPKLERIDWILVVSFFLSIFFGFLITLFPANEIAAIICLILSCVFYIPVLFLPFLIPSARKGMYMNLNYDEPMYQKLVKLHKMALWITLTMPAFPLVYLLAAVGVVTQEQTAIAFAILSVFDKGLYAVILMDLNADSVVVYKWKLRQEIGANDSRRAFMKCIFHEVRTPLNSICMGIDILEQSSAARDETERFHILFEIFKTWTIENDVHNKISRESLVLMRSASEFMAATLNDVLSLQKIEEGKMELEMCSFKFAEAIKSVFNTFRGAAIGKGIQLVLTMLECVPARVLGDRFKLEHSISNLLSNAIKFSPRNAVVEIVVSAILSDEEVAVECSRPGREGAGDVVGKEDEWATVVVEVRDYGPGISPQNQLKLFGDFVQINPGEMQQGQVCLSVLSFMKNACNERGLRIAGLWVRVVPMQADGGAAGRQSHRVVNGRGGEHLPHVHPVPCLGADVQPSQQFAQP